MRGGAGLLQSRGHKAGRGREGGYVTGREGGYVTGRGGRGAVPTAGLGGGEGLLG